MGHYGIAEICEGLLMFTMFSDWRTKTAIIKSKTTAVNSSGIPENTETVIATTEINYWTDNSNESNVNDKFVNQAVGRAILPPGIIVKTTMLMEIDGVDHYITGVDDVAGLGEITVVKWRRSNGD